jgi:hypothetical protein
MVSRRGFVQVLVSGAALAAVARPAVGQTKDRPEAVLSPKGTLFLTGLQGFMQPGVDLKTYPMNKSSVLTRLNLETKVLEKIWLPVAQATAVGMAGTELLCSARNDGVATFLDTTKPQATVVGRVELPPGFVFTGGGVVAEDHGMAILCASPQKVATPNDTGMIAVINLKTRGLEALVPSGGLRPHTVRRQRKTDLVYISHEGAVDGGFNLNGIQMTHAGVAPKIVRFDLKKRTVVGETPVVTTAEHLFNAAMGGFDVADDGTLVVTLHQGIPFIVNQKYYRRPDGQNPRTVDTLNQLRMLLGDLDYALPINALNEGDAMLPLPVLVIRPNGTIDEVDVGRPFQRGFGTVFIKHDEKTALVVLDQSDAVISIPLTGPINAKVLTHKIAGELQLQDINFFVDVPGTPYVLASCRYEGVALVNVRTLTTERRYTVDIFDGSGAVASV